MPSMPEMKRVLKLIDMDKALEWAVQSFEVDLSSETVSVEHAVNRILAEDVISKRDSPEYDQAFYDGYAINSSDTEPALNNAPVKLKIVGRMMNNDRPNKIILRGGEAVFIESGAPLPEGADAVVRLEAARIENGYLVVKRGITPGESVVSKGHDFRHGDIILRSGSILRPQDIGLLMELGIPRVKVLRRLRVGVIPIGSDLLERGSSIAYPDNYSWIASAYLKLFGFETLNYGIVKDDRAEIRGTILKAAREDDALLLVGGASVSSDDFVPDVLNEIGRVIFHGLRVSPGKVTGFAVVDGKPVFMIPAHIGSTMAALFLIVIPALFYKLTGVRDPYIKIRARLTGDVEAKPGVFAFRPVSVSYVDGGYQAKPIYKQLGGSPFLTSFTEANGFMLVEPGRGPLGGDSVEIRIFSHLELPRIYKG